ncbi:hypothetical protein DL95DRAFT_480735 [Leptodontidium sp. 2 PMI_412]|nr:hypothetical protein DL95DRAFT_480735 [Leptodontidium sp. 2 PMI_412]
MILVWSAIAFANCWVWFAGVNLGKKDGCDVKVFSVSIYHDAWQTFLRIVAVIGCILGMVFTIIGILAIRWNLTTSFTQRHSKEPSKRRNLRPELRSTAFQIVMGALAIVVTEMTEMTMKINDYQMSEPLGSSRQLLPFSIAVVNVVATIGSGFRNLVQ